MGPSDCNAALKELTSWMIFFIQPTTTPRKPSSDFNPKRPSCISTCRIRFKLFSIQTFNQLQAVHAPYSDAPAWERVKDPTFWDPVFGDMLAVVDSGIYNGVEISRSSVLMVRLVTQTLHETNRWDDALVIVSSDK